MKGMRRKMYGFKCTAIRVYRPASLSTGPKEMLDNESRPDIESLIGRKWFVSVVILGNSVAMKKDDPERYLMQWLQQDHPQGVMRNWLCCGHR